ncbi:MAG TPA: sugar kinase [Ktedonobacterales bacterium]
MSDTGDMHDTARRIVTFGEALLRFTPPQGESLERAQMLSVEVAGAEANVAVALARLGAHAAFVSRLPDQALGWHVRNKLREHGVDVTHVALVPGARQGVFYYEPGRAPRAGYVLYDRAHSAFATMQSAEFPLAALDGADLLHLSGITLCLGAGPRGATERAVIAARARHIPVSLDLNYRARLATPEQAREWYEPIMRESHILIFNRRDLVTLFGITGSPDEQLAQFHQRYPATICVMTDGANGAYALAPHAMDGVVHVAALPGVEHDRLGRGDAFCAGFVWGLLQLAIPYGLQCGVALASLQQTYSGDLSWCTRAQLLALVEGNHGTLDR